MSDGAGAHPAGAATGALRDPSAFLQSSGNFVNINFLSFDDPFNIK